MRGKEKSGYRGPIRVPKTSEIVARHFREQIIRGELGEGSRLPSEGMLLTSLGISRPTLREAFRILEAENLISVSRGSRTGAQVLAPSSDLVVRYAGMLLQSLGTTVADLYAARAAVEPAVVEWMVTHPNPETAGRLRDRIQDLRALLSDGKFDLLAREMAQFHAALVDVSGNRSLGLMSRILLELTARHQVDFVHRHPGGEARSRKQFGNALDSYARLVDLVEAANVEAALAHWQQHLAAMLRFWAGGEEGRRSVDMLA